MTTIRETLVVLIVVAFASCVDGFSSLSNSRKPLTCLSVAITSDSSRLKRIASLRDWADQAGIKIGSVSVDKSESGGLGVFATQDVSPNSILITVPTEVALSVESPGDGPNDRAVFDMVEDRRVLRETPWFVQFSLYLHYLDDMSTRNIRPWLDSLPRSFDTPIHWPSTKGLQYDHLSDSVERQASEWKALYEKLKSCGSTRLQGFSWDDFVWGCECARSRAFSGAYTGSAFNPLIYAFTLLLVIGYVGLGFGTLEQAANGAGLVLAASIFKDFVLPKLSKTKRYVICPVIDMANHNSVHTCGEVSFEFFGDAYSLAAMAPVVRGNEIYISYGGRSNDQLLQYYGFLEEDNPHDVYVMPPLREWNIEELETACGRTFAPGRLEKLNRAGLLGSTTVSIATTTTSATSGSAIVNANNDKDDEEYGNPRGGVVLTRANGLDPAVLQALRALVSTQDEWLSAGSSIGNFVEPLNADNERAARLAARRAVALELESKPTTLQQDLELLSRFKGSQSLQDAVMEQELAIRFRIEKKKVLQETMDKLVSS